MHSWAGSDLISANYSLDPQTTIWAGYFLAKEEWTASSGPAKASLSLQVVITTHGGGKATDGGSNTSNLGIIEVHVLLMSMVTEYNIE